MEVVVRGDLRKVARVRMGVEDAPRRVRRLVPAVGAAALDELRKGIDAGQAPDGTSWRRTTDGRQPLQGGMRASWSLVVVGSTASLRSGHEGAGMHQRGGVIRAKRTGRGAGGRYTRGKLGVLVFVVGGRAVFARKVKIPQRRMHPARGTLERWEPRIRQVIDDGLAESVGGRT